MSVWSKVLTAEERVEVEEAVVAAYVDTETGGTRTHVEASPLFAKFIDDAAKAQRKWARLLSDEWSEDGRNSWLRRMWGRRDAFTNTHNGKAKRKNLNRGVRRRDHGGAPQWTKESLLAWSVGDLERAILDSALRVDQERANIKMCGRLVDLCTKTKTVGVGDALKKRGLTLDEYLAECDQTERSA